MLLPLFVTFSSSPSLWHYLYNGPCGNLWVSQTCIKTDWIRRRKNSNEDYYCNRKGSLSKDSVIHQSRSDGLNLRLFWRPERMYYSDVPDSLVLATLLSGCFSWCRLRETGPIVVCNLPLLYIGPATARGNWRCAKDYWSMQSAWDSGEGCEIVHGQAS